MCHKKRLNVRKRIIYILFLFFIDFFHMLNFLRFVCLFFTLATSYNSIKIVNKLKRTHISGYTKVIYLFNFICDNDGGKPFFSGIGAFLIYQLYPCVAITM